MEEDFMIISIIYGDNADTMRVNVISYESKKDFYHQRILKALESTRIDIYDINEYYLNILFNNENIIYLCFNRKLKFPIHISSITKLINLTTLDLTHVDVIHDDELSKLVNLEKLSFIYPQMPKLDNMKYLSIVKLTYYGSQTYIENIIQLYNVRSLILSTNNLRLHGIRKLRNLQSLVIYNCGNYYNYIVDLRLLSELTDLTNLEIYTNTRGSILCLQRLHKLKVLYITRIRSLYDLLYAPSIFKFQSENFISPLLH